MAEENKTLDGKGTQTLVQALHAGIERNKKICGPPLRKRQEILSEFANGWFTDEQRTRRPMNMGGSVAQKKKSMFLGCFRQLRKRA